MQASLEIDIISQGLSEKSKQRVLKITTEARNSIIADNMKQAFKRKNFIKAICKLRNEIPEKDIVSKMSQID